MKKFVLAPDSFKGTMFAAEICDIWQKEIAEVFPNSSVTSIPMADGGEGMVDSYLNILSGEKICCQVTGPRGNKIDSYYGILKDKTAVMEMALCAGLPLMGDKPNVMAATTFGVGEMILHAAKNGVTNIIMGLGGSATNDCGIGMAAVLGYKFMSEGKEVSPSAENMSVIDRIIRPESLPDIKITAACDVDNPLFGKMGAAYIFAPQKGADEHTVKILDNGLKNMSRVIKNDLSVAVDEIKGGGAAGGLGAGIVAFLGGELLSGIDLLLNTCGFDELIKDADFVFTGEGRIDGQSIHGKVPVGVSTRCKRAKVPCIALCGSIGTDAEKVYDMGITSIFSAVTGPCSFDEVKATCKKDIGELMNSVLRLIKSVDRN